MHTYFIAGTTRVKIGKSIHPARRVAALQNSSPELLTLLLTVKGDREKEFHQRFARDRVHGEWFVLSVDIQQFLAAYKTAPEIPLQPPKQLLITLTQDKLDEAQEAERVATLAFPTLSEQGFVVGPPVSDAAATATALAFLRRCHASKAQYENSYRLQHLIEKWGAIHRLSKAIPNGAIIAAAVYLGLVVT